MCVTGLACPGAGEYWPRVQAASPGSGARPCTELAPAEEKASPLEPFRDGEPGGLTNVGILTEGHDDPGIDCIVMARPAPGKRDCVVIEVLDASRSHASSMVTLPTLFGLPPRFDLRGRAATEVVRQYHAAARMLGDSGIPEELAQQVLTPEDIRAMMVEVDLLRYAMVPPAVAAASDLVWQRMPDDTYVPPVGNSTEVVVRQNVLGRWEVVPSGPGMETVKHGECLSVTDAIRPGTGVVKDMYPTRSPCPSCTRQPGGGRSRLPRSSSLCSGDSALTLPGATRGRASLLITQARQEVAGLAHWRVIDRLTAMLREDLRVDVVMTVGQVVRRYACLQPARGTEAQPPPVPVPVENP